MCDESKKDRIEKIYFEVTSRCNLNCIMCFRNSWIDESYGDLPYETFQRVLEEPVLDQAKTVFFGGMGEPLLHPDILNMVRDVKRRGLRAEMVTNGTLLTEETAMGLLEAGLDEIWISVDGFSAEHYDAIREGSHFALVEENLRNLDRLRKAAQTEGEFNALCGGPQPNASWEGEPRASMDLGLTYVAMKSNLDELARLPAFAMSLNAQHVNISNVLPSTPEMEKEILYEKTVNLQIGTGEKNTPSSGKQWSLPAISIPYFDLDGETARRGLAAVLGTVCPVEFSNHSILRRRGYCKFIEEGNVFVRWDGDVSPCMALLHSAKSYFNGYERVNYHYTYGNVHEDTLEKIWNSEEYAAFRRRVKAFDFSPCMQCGGCEFREENREDCMSGEGEGPRCGACLWSEGILSCP